jgi:hypothetical protein
MQKFENSPQPFPCFPMATKTIRISFIAAALIALTGLLTGCIVSKGALFDPSQGAKSLAAGRYQIQDYVVGNWVNRENGRLKIDGSNYTWSDKPDDETDMGLKFTLHNIGGGLFVAMMESPGEEYDHGYDLLQVTDEGILQYSVDCESANRVLGIESPGIKRGGGKCFVATASDLKDLLRAYAKRSFPRRRYVRQDE